ncbi:hypothetical protein AG1IA_07801 [Rhizoctonia solani AG-1 IA]|uniref:Secreted protein n=1 Tax=Thanatephorus cucumeris (strain AG1-IA) TaxID=983506 RepID=L8WP95_THACA|nr:hypothetical protein AG1IA_07801 [Rhizoctonia solani AG-1 IA]
MRILLPLYFALSFAEVFIISVQLSTHMNCDQGRTNHTQFIYKKHSHNCLNILGNAINLVGMLAHVWLQQAPRRTWIVPLFRSSKR